MALRKFFQWRPNIGVCGDARDLVAGGAAISAQSYTPGLHVTARDLFLHLIEIATSRQQE
jgi:hypothetical protein